MKHRFFTLVEMLVVIAVISILAAIVMPGVTSAMRKADEAKAKADMSALITAIKGFESTYRKYPEALGTDNGECDDYTKLIETLTAQESGKKHDNVRMIQFLEPVAGASDSEKYNFKDPWGEDYKIYVNVKRDRGGIEVGEDNDKLRGDVFVYSLGFDGKDGKRTSTEGKNNVTSWEK